jgi:hypothetical protein
MSESKIRYTLLFSALYMDRSLLSSSVLAALISAIVSAIGSIVSYRIARRTIKAQADLKITELNHQAVLKAQELDTQTRIKAQELDTQARLKARELESLAAKLRVDEEGLRQAQMTEILKKRIETYPALYELISVFGRNWGIEGKPRDRAWASLFLKALVENNAKNGAFFSDRVYEQYGKLRTVLERLTRSLAGRCEATDQEMAELFDLIRGTTLASGERAAGLGTYIKDELGSYLTAFVSSSYGDSRSIHLVSKESAGSN